MSDAPTRYWWLSPEPGAELSGPYTEAEAKQRWKDGRTMWPQQGVWRGPDAQHLQPAHPSWAAGAPPSRKLPAAWAPGLSNDELADVIDQHAAGIYTRPDYRKAALAEAAARLRGVFCRCCVDNECECEGLALADGDAGEVSTPEGLAALAGRVDGLKEAETAAARALNAAGVSWARIGEAQRITRQSAHLKYSRPSRRASRRPG